MFVFHLSPGTLSALGPHRTRSGWEICEADEALWLRCPETPAEAEATCALPVLARYRTDSQNRLIPWQGTLPVAVAPAGPWQALAAYLEVTPFPARLPGRNQQRVTVTLVPSPHETEAAALLAELADLLAWADQASRLRLGRLKFAASRNGRVLVTGTPLPPIPGTACYFHGALVLPCGWDFAAPLQSGWVELSLALPPGALALLDPAGGVEIISQEAIVPLTLAALRRTQAAMATVC
jgi:hypothetical protein